MGLDAPLQPTWINDMKDSYTKGTIIPIVCVLFYIALFVLYLAGSNYYRIKISSEPLKTAINLLIFTFGVVQMVYIIPIHVVLFKRRMSKTIKGLWYGAGIVFVLNILFIYFLPPY